jgi:hypothetical protein
MKFLRQLILSAGVISLLAHPLETKADATNTPPDFKEVYDLIRTHLAGASPGDLDRAAVQGLVSQLHSKVSLVSGPTGTNATADAPLLAKPALYDGPIGYLRIQQVGDGLADQITSAYKELNRGTNQLKGLVLDLRFADGHDYATAASVADLFLAKEAPLLDWGNGVVRSKAKSGAITIPVAVLVNQQTSAAAEALAAVLRQTDRGLILGSNTAGAANIDQEFPLKNGQHLRIATATIKLGDGETLSANGVTPDIQVSVNPEDEKAYFADPFKEISKPSNLLASLSGSLSGSSTNGTSVSNRPPRTRISEADLIRERKADPGKEIGYEPPSSRSASEAETDKPIIRDPVLGRALDLIKGLSVLGSSHPS